MASCESRLQRRDAAGRRVNRSEIFRPVARLQQDVRGEGAREQAEPLVVGARCDELSEWCFCSSSQKSRSWDRTIRTQLSSFDIFCQQGKQPFWVAPCPIFVSFGIVGDIG